jgi:hypothetical protein
LSRTLTISVTAAIATVTLAAGVVYSVIRPANYESDAKIVLVPGSTDPEAAAGLLSTYTRSGTAGTYVDLVLSADTLERAGDPPVDLSANAIPDTRAIAITAKSGDREVVRPALTALLLAAQQERQKLADDWRIRILQAPTVPSEANVSTAIILIATVILALLGALITWTFLGRVGAQQQRRPPRDEAISTPGWRASGRYPVNR